MDAGFPTCFRWKGQDNRRHFGHLLGGLGIHKFYLGQTLMGFLYLFFCWTFIPELVALIEGIIFLTLPDDEFQSRYGTPERALRRPLF